MILDQDLRMVSKNNKIENLITEISDSRSKRILYEIGLIIS